MKKTFISFILFLSYIVGFSQFLQDTEFARQNYQGKRAKYVFLFIGDGMGQVQVSSAEHYISDVKGNKNSFEKLVMSRFPVQSLASTNAANRFITGSAAAGTALATGQKTTINTISMDSMKTTPLTTIAEIAKQKGMKVGIVSTVSLDHATPAAFYAHQSERNEYYQIALQLPRSGFDYFAGGGIIYPAGKQNNGKNVFEYCQEKGYQVLRDKKEFQDFQDKSRKLFAISPVLADEKSNRYAIDQDSRDITLAELTQKGIELLGNPDGFFMMVESGKIDWACHSNDIATSIHEVIAFDEAIQKAVEFYQLHPDETLIVVTADHETGGLTLGNKIKKYNLNFKLLKHQKISAEQFTHIIDSIKATGIIPNFREFMHIVKHYFGLENIAYELGLSYRDRGVLKDAYVATFYDRNSKADFIERKYGGNEPIVSAILQTMAEKAGIGWTTHKHTAMPVPVKVLGTGSELFNGYIDNTDIPKNILSITGWQLND